MSNHQSPHVARTKENKLRKLGVGGRIVNDRKLFKPPLFYLCGVLPEDEPPPHVVQEVVVAAGLEVVVVRQRVVDIPHPK